MDLFGWDTIFATTLSKANQALRAGMANLVSSFTFSESGFDLTGAFAPWQMVTGGAGKLLHMQVPIVSGTMKSGSGSIDLAGLSVTVEVSLQLLPSQAGAGASDLRFNFSSVGSTPGSATPGLVTPLSISDPQNRLTSVQQRIVMGAVANCLVQNGPKVSYIFGTINPLAISIPWLRPAASDYAYADAQGSSDGVLAILSVTSNRDISALQRGLDQTVIQGWTGDAFLAIAPALTLPNLIQPGLPAAFGCSASQFAFSPSAPYVNQPAIYVASPFGLPRVDASGESYYPRVTGGVLLVQNNVVACSLSGDCDMGMGIGLTFSWGGGSPITFDPTSKIIGFTPDPNPTFSHDTSMSWYDYFFDIIPVSAIILNVTVAVIGNQIGGSLQQGLAGGISIAKTPPLLVQWNGTNQFNVTGVELATALILRGSFS